MAGIAGWAASQIAAAWSQIDPAALTATCREWVGAASDVVKAAQTEAVATADAYLAVYLSSETGTGVAPLGLSSTRWVGLTRTGDPVASLFGQAVGGLRWQLQEGADLQRASQVGLSRAVQVVDTEVHRTSREALQEAMVTQPLVSGYRRVSGGGCGACLAAATGAVHADDVLLQVHPRCHCSMEPVVRGVAETVTRPTGEDMFAAMAPAEQDALFDGRGGAQKADLVRSGQVSLSDLLMRDQTVELGRGITERPLEAFT